MLHFFVQERTLCILITEDWKAYHTCGEFSTKNTSIIFILITGIGPKLPLIRGGRLAIVDGLNDHFKVKFAH